MIQGQEKICSLIDNSTLDSFPRTLMLVGSRGSGKHLLCNYISDKFNLTTVDLTETINQETIDEIYNRVEPYLYTININAVSVKEENTILKFLEEPLKNSFIILLAETDNGILQTIINRCQIWYLQPYKKSFLESFMKCDNSFILEIAQTPGMVIELSNAPLEGMIELADKILAKIGIASISNALKLSSTIGFKNEKNTFDGKLFVQILQSRIKSHWVTNSDIRFLHAYNLTNELKKDILVRNLDCKALFEDYLIELRNIMKGNNV